MFEQTNKTKMTIPLTTTLVKVFSKNTFLTANQSFLQFSFLISP